MIWKDIPGWKGFYQVSKCGQVRSLTRTIKCFWMGKNRVRIYKGKILRSKFKTGYPHVNLIKNQNKVCFNVHDLVLLTFKGPKPKGMEVLHGNGKKWDNRFENLRYGTNAENHADKYRHGYKHPCGSKNKHSKFNAQERIELKKLLKLGYSVNGLAAVFDVSHNCISQALRLP